MGASNFYNKNANRVYAVGMSEEVKYKQCPECDHKFYDYDDNYPEKEEGVCPECEEEVTFKNEEEYRSLEREEWEELESYIQETLAKLVGYNDGGKDDNDRSYYGKSMGYLSASKTYGDAEIEVRVQAMLRSAYHDGANLDYNDAELLVDGYERDFDSDYIAYQFAVSMNNGLAKIQSKNALKWAVKAKEELEKQLEEAYTKIAMPLKVVAAFSNGETMYAKD